MLYKMFKCFTKKKKKKKDVEIEPLYILCFEKIYHDPTDFIYSSHIIKENKENTFFFNTVDDRI